MGQKFYEEQAEAPKVKRRLDSIGKLMTGGLVETLRKKGMVLVKLQLTDRGYEFFLVVTAILDSDGTGIVAFHTGEDMATVLTSFARKLKAGHVKWRVDKPWSPRRQNDE